VPSGGCTLASVRFALAWGRLQSSRFWCCAAALLVRWAEACAAFCGAAEARLTSFLGCCSVSVGAGVTSDLAGNPNLAAAGTYIYEPSSKSIQDYSTACNVLVGTSLAAAAAMPVVAAFLNARAPPAMMGHSFVALLLFLQTTYLMGHMAVPYFPQNFQQWATGFRWALLDVKCVFETGRGVLAFPLLLLKTPSRSCSKRSWPEVQHSFWPHAFPALPSAHACPWPHDGLGKCAGCADTPRVDEDECKM
jgi:hypothetical protein